MTGERSGLVGEESMLAYNSQCDFRRLLDVAY